MSVFKGLGLRLGLEDSRLTNKCSQGVTGVGTPAPSWVEKKIVGVIYREDL